MRPHEEADCGEQHSRDESGDALPACREQQEVRPGGGNLFEHRADSAVKVPAPVAARKSVDGGWFPEQDSNSQVAIRLGGLVGALLHHFHKASGA